MLEAVAQNKIGKVLIDGRGLASSGMERFYYGEFAAQAVAKFAARGVPPATSLRMFLKSQSLTLGGSAKPSQ
jgi:hypothetical protein